MTDRERLLSLINEMQDEGICYGEHGYGVRVDNERIADHLIANGVTFKQGGWIPVSLGFLPEKGGEYLCRCVVHDIDDMPFYMVLRYYIVDKNPHFQHEQTGGMKVTHWMPLPELPKGERKDDE